MLKSVNVMDIIKNAKGNVIPKFLQEENPEAKVMPAFIDLSVTCMRCGRVLYSGCYQKGIIDKLKKKIKKAKWVHHPAEGTLCPDCFNAVNTISRN